MKKGLSLFLSLVIAFGTVALCGHFQVDAATFDEINQPSIFVKQQVEGSSGTCTLASAVMMVRRAALATGNSNWSAITESAMRSTAWKEGSGLRYGFTYAGITVAHANLPGGSSNTQRCIDLLAAHPEGIVLYNNGYPHAVLLTDYTDGVFYCADPQSGVSSGRISISNAKNVTISNADEYWYVSSPKVTLTTYYNPQGVVDIIEGQNGSVFVYGWAFDRDSPSSSIKLHVYIDSEKYEVMADIYRSDVNSDYNITGNHGFSATIQTSLRGNHLIQVYALNMFGGGNNMLLDQKTVNILPASAPANVWVNLPNGEESSYVVNTDFNILFGAENATSYHLNIWRKTEDGAVPYWDGWFDDTNGTAYCSARFSIVGHYSCYVTACNQDGSIDSTWIGWDVVDTVPFDLSINVDKTSYPVNSTVNFTLKADGGYYKHIGIHRIVESSDSLYYEQDVVGENCSVIITEPGRYCANFDAFNACGVARSDLIYFSVYDCAPSTPTIITNKTSYKLGEEVQILFTVSQFSKKAYFTIRDLATNKPVIGPGLPLDTTVVSYNFIPLNAGDYNLEYQTTNEFGASECATKTIHVFILGDVDRDGEIGLKDVVQITRYLAGGWDATVDLAVADVNHDGEVNLKDAVILRRYLAGGWDIELK